MSLVKRSADLVYAFRFIRLLTTKWKETDAYELGIVNEKGDRIKSKRITTRQERAAYTPFVRLVFNIKRILEKVPGTRLASFASALYLVKEDANLSDRSLEYILKECGHFPEDFLSESTGWFMIEENRVSPGIYRVITPKALNEGYEELVRPKDQVRVVDGYPVGKIFDLDIYEAIHLKTNKPIYVTASELMK